MIILYSLTFNSVTNIITGCGKKTSPIWNVNKNQAKQRTKKKFLKWESSMSVECLKPPESFSLACGSCPVESQCFAVTVALRFCKFLGFPHRKKNQKVSNLAQTTHFLDDDSWVASWRRKWHYRYRNNIASGVSKLLLLLFVDHPR